MSAELYSVTPFRLPDEPMPDGREVAPQDDLAVDDHSVIDETSKATLPPQDLICAGNWPDRAPAPVRWAVTNKIPRGDVTTLDGDGGLGKTMAGLQLATAITLGQSDWLGHEIPEHGPVVCLSAEEPESEIHRRLFRIAQRRSFSMGDLRDLHLWFPSDVGDCLLSAQNGRGAIEPTGTFRALAERINQIRPALVILDNVAAVYGGSQIDRFQVRSFINQWRGLARSSDAAVLLLNHPSLNGLTAGNGRGGSMDWRNAVRAALHLKPAPDKADADRGVRILETVKANYAPLGEETRLEWVDGVLTVEGTASPIQRAAQDAQADQTFIALLQRHIQLGIEVGPAPGRSYAPTVFEASHQNGGYRAKALAVVMHRLIEAQRIVIREEGPPSKRRKRLALP